MNRQVYPFVIKIFVLAGVFLQKLFDLSSACFAGFWLGVLKKGTLDLIVSFCFDNTKMYHSEKFNLGGLFRWEEKAVNRYFQKCKYLLVAGAGGGREVLALHQLGYDTDGFDCNIQLVEQANKLFKKEGLVSNIKHVLPDQCPDGTKIYNGIIIGWSVYMHIQGRKQRIAFLRKLRNQTQELSPILLSFSHRLDDSLYFKMVAIIGNVIRWFLRRDYLEIGDDLARIHEVNIYGHCFTKEEIDFELQEGGFQLDFYCTDVYGHAVGIASKPSGKISI